MFMWHVFLPSPRVTCFSREPWFVSLDNVIRNQDVGTECLLLLGYHFF